MNRRYLQCARPLAIAVLVYFPGWPADGQPLEQLGSVLTPVGAERAGNAAGSIPRWDGGFTSSSPGYAAASPRSDPFANEKPLFSITAANYQHYASLLPEGSKALFRRDPDYRMDIYPTHRTAAFPRAVYDNILRNATRAHAAPEGIAYGVEGAAGGIPFPIPANGTEIVWNHLLAFWGAAREVHVDTWVVSPDGTRTLSSGYEDISDFPYYFADAQPGSYGGYYFKTRRIADAPPQKAGQGYLDCQPIDTARYPFAAWRLVPGERRARRTPSISYDVPDPDASGYENLDEYYIFFGGPDRYEFKLLGKKEMFVPYNNNRLYARASSEVLGQRHANPDDLRYELHRVWVVEGTLAPGKHHIVPKRRLYIDEDTWLAVYGDSWDDSGKYWKFGEATMYLMPDVPATIIGSQFVYDLELGGYVMGFAFNDARGGYRITLPHPQSLFTPQSLAATAVR